MSEKLANYQPTITQLNQTVERLRNLGQLTEADEILRVTSQYEMLGDQVCQQIKKCKQAVSARQQLEDQMKEIDNLVKECEDSTDSVIGLQVPVQEKIEKLKVSVFPLFIWSTYFMDILLFQARNFDFLFCA